MTKTSTGLSAFSLRNLAMLLMLIDHIGLVFFPDILLFRYIGRLAFPIFAFLIVEGYCHTRNLRNYLLRLLGLAIITDLPSQYMSQGNFDYVPFQNVIWTFLISLVAIALIDHSRKQLPLIGWLPLSLVVTALAGYVAFWANTDYNYIGVLMVLGFYYFRGQGALHRLGQALMMFLTNIILASIRWYQDIPFVLQDFGLYWNTYGMQIIPSQIWAVLALIPIWSYNGQAGHRSKASQAGAYLFYPVHMLALGFLGQVFL